MNETVLVVDDEDLNRKLIEAILIPLGYRVLMARDGHEVFDMVRRVQPDVILLDVMMPRMDGFEVARRLKQDEHTRIIPIIMVTSLSAVEDRVKAIEAGADDFLSKPVDKTELRARVKSLCAVKAYSDHMHDYQKKLEQEVARQTAELKAAMNRVKNASLDTIYLLSRAAEYKDEETGEHIKRISRYAVVVARSLGLDPASIESLLYAAPMHDVGKIGIPDRILLKPGKLDSEEWGIMKQHVTIGAEILEGSQNEFLPMAHTIACTHHEKWDGSGYPLGLVGEDIPVAGRVVAVVDVFDALTSNRPYKRAYTLEESLRIIEENRGTHFDPIVLDAFLRAKEEIVAVKTDFQGTEESKFLKLAGVI